MRFSNLARRSFRALLAVAMIAAAGAMQAQTTEQSNPWLNVYGFAMMDSGYNADQINPNWYDTMRVTKLPSFKDQFAPDGNAFFSVRQTRFGVKAGTSGDTLVGRISINRNDVIVISDKPFKLTRGDIIAITPIAGSRKFFKRWFAKIDAGITILTGNTDQNDFNVSGRVKRQTAKNRLIADYIANVSNSNNKKISNNQRVRFNWDRFLTPRFYVKPVGAEWYADPFQNINSRTTVGSGAGYQILQTPRTKWEAGGGIA